MAMTASLLEHAEGACVGAWRLEPRADGFHWRCARCLRSYPATLETAYRVAVERELAEVMLALANEGCAIRSREARA
jgi:hypothetical protein